MKKIIALLLLLIITMSTSGCALLRPNMGETTLEFQIGENVDDVDFSKYQQKIRYGYMGPGIQYYGTGYFPRTDKEGMQVDPEHCVIYTTGAFPDVSSRKRHITEIFISDPTVIVFGITLNSSKEEIDHALKRYGFKEQPVGNVGKTEWVNGKYHIMYTQGKGMYIEFDTSNVFRIQW